MATPDKSYVFIVPWDLGGAGGVNQVVENLFREFQVAGEFVPRIVVNDWDSPGIDEQIIESRPTTRLRLASPWGNDGSIAWLLKWLVYSPLMLSRFLRYCGRHNAVAINYHYPSLAVFPVALLKFVRLFRGSLVLSFHGLDIKHLQESGKVESLLWRFVLSQSDRIIACSSAFAHDLQQVTGQVDGKVLAVRNGLSLENLFAEQEVDSDLDDLLRDRTYIASVATFEHKKGLDVLIESFAAIHTGFPDLSLVLAGRSESQEAALRAQVESLGLGQAVLILPNVPHKHIGQILQHAALFCLPSRSEPFGIALLEAGAYELPVVASRTGGIPEIITDNEHGLLVASDDADGLSKALSKLLHDSDLAGRLGRNLRDRVSREFGWDRAYREYRSVLNQHRDA